MYCKKCGAQNKDGAKFCTSCGAALTVNQTNNTAYPQPENTAVKRSNKKIKTIIIGLVAVLVAVAVASAILISRYLQPPADYSEDESVTIQEEQTVDVMAPVETLQESHIYAYAVGKTLYNESLAVDTMGEVGESFTLNEDGTITKTSYDEMGEKTKKAQITSFTNGIISFSVDTIDYTLILNNTDDGVTLETSETEGRSILSLTDFADKDSAFTDRINSTMWKSDYFSTILSTESIIFGSCSSVENDYNTCLFYNQSKAVYAHFSVLGSDICIDNSTDGYRVWLSQTEDENVLTAYIEHYEIDDDYMYHQLEFCIEKWTKLGEDEINAYMLAAQAYASTVSLENLNAFTFGDYEEKYDGYEYYNVDENIDKVIAPGFKSMFIKDNLEILERHDGKYYIPPCDYEGVAFVSFVIDTNSLEQGDDYIKCDITRTERDWYTEDEIYYDITDSISLKLIDGKWMVDDVDFNFNYH